MGLRRYRSRRDFAQTPEPRGRVKRRARGLRFVVQKHDARRLHYDFRLELDGVLKSWAVPKGPSLDPSVKRLAAHVEDHPLDYASFEGVIPAGHYGAGNVIVWDEGTWTPAGDAARSYHAGKLEFRLDGTKLRGSWKLVRMRGRERNGKENWLLIKGPDGEVRRGAAAEITAARPESVKSGVDVSEVGEAPARKRQPSPGRRRKALPATLRPQLATLVDRMPPGDGWAFEIKYDGYRVLARVKGGRTRLFTRNGKDWTDRFRRQARELARLPVREAWIDGEMCVFRADGMTDFQGLQNACAEGSDRDVIYMAFDLVHLDGRDLSGLPLTERKRLLKERLEELGDGVPVRYSEHVEGAGDALYEHACQHELEGLIGKRLDSTYEPKRSLSWVKVKCRRRQEFVIGGYTEPQGSRTGFGALLIGVHEKGGLHYAGRVGTGFDGATLGALRKRFSKLTSSEPPFVDADRIAGRRLHWVRPELVAEVNFAGWTNDGVLRQASFVSLRDDKPPRHIRREEAVKPVKIERAKKAAARKKGGEQVAGITISHPDRVLFSDTGFTKLDLARYYERVAEWMLPHVAARPLSLVRCPQGPGEKCFFQKHLAQGLPSTVDGVTIREKGGESARYLVANTGAALVALVQMGVIEFHTWGARSKAPDVPDRLILDLDPGPGVAWGRVVEAATLARALFDELGLKCFLKTTGGKGLHVVVPLAARHEWDEVKDFSRAAAEQMERTFPSRYTSKMSKAGRKGKIFIDYLRNGRGATAVAAYSVRARPGATVSVPVGWDELADGVRSDTYNANNVFERLHGRRKDPWAGYFTSRQRITRAMKRALGADG